MIQGENIKKKLITNLLRKIYKTKTNSKESQLIIIIDLKTNKQTTPSAETSFFFYWHVKFSLQNTKSLLWQASSNFPTYSSGWNMTQNQVSSKHRNPQPASDKHSNYEKRVGPSSRKGSCFSKTLPITRSSKLMTLHPHHPREYTKPTHPFPRISSIHQNLITRSI